MNRLAVKKSFAVQSKDVTMDMNADDAEGMRRKKSLVTWFVFLFAFMNDFQGSEAQKVRW